MNRRLLIAAAAMLASAAAAQPAPPPPALAQAPDEARLAAARTLVELSLPTSWIDQIVRAIGRQSSGPPDDPRQARRDRHLAERTRLTRAAVESEVRRVLRAEEPGLRAMMADLFARQLTLQDLQAANRFYSSPAGQRLLSAVLEMATDPDYLAVQAEVAPLNAAAMERAYRRFVEESANLPPLPGMDVRQLPVRAELAAPPAPAAPRPRSTPPPAPERLAAAQRAVQALWRPEAMDLPSNLDPLLDAVLAMPVAAFGFPLPPEWGIGADATVAQLVGRFDPAFRERARLAMRIWAEETNRSNAEAAPIYRRAIADFYARYFTLAELDEFTRFYAGPEGTRLMAASIQPFEDPQFVAYLARALPRLLAELPRAIERVEAATAHLPAPPAPRRRRQHG